MLYMFGHSYKRGLFSTPDGLPLFGEHSESPAVGVP